MKDIALAILAVGLCFYNTYRIHTGQQQDILAGLVAFIAVLELIF